MSVRDQAVTTESDPALPFERARDEGEAELDFLLGVWTRRNGRDLASPDVWEESAMRARLKRRAAAQRPKLPQARSLTVTLVAAAATAAAPAAALSQPRSSGGGGGATKTLKRSSLQLGDRGPRVAELQRQLGIEADGIFGPKTRAAVRAFQKKQGLKVDGIAGPETRAALSAGGARTAAAKGASGSLKLGARGAKVAELQRALGITADGIFGPKTRAAVRAFQQRKGLVVDGIAGPKTFAALAAKGGAQTAAAKSASGSLKLGARGAKVAELQRALGITADGIFGPKTRAAVRAFQQRKGLVVDGIVGPKTWAALRGGGTPASGGSGGSGSATLVSSSGPASVDKRLWGALQLAQQMGLRFMSGHRPGASVGGSGKRSDHSYYPSKAIDVGGSAGNMARYARAVAGRPGVQTVIYGPVGIWISGIGWRPISSSYTYRTHLDHVHVDTF